MDDRLNGHADVARANSSSSSSFSSVRRGGTAFSMYAASQPVRQLRSSSLRIVERKSLVTSLTKNLVETYQKCNTNFRYSENLNPKRYLTNPSATVLNDGHDNANSDLVLYVNLELLNSKENRRYVVKDMLGQGTFGQVAKCWDAETNNYVAVKVIKNQPAYTQQALVEVSILHLLNRNFDPDDRHHIVRILDYFEHHQHLCIAFEMLGSNLYELIKRNRYKGLSLSYVQSFSKQILHALIMMKEAGIIHCDLKPENILLSPRAKPPEIKVIDFGSACREGKTIYSYIQSRYYRSPEVLLGYPYTTAIDMWSFGCIVAELFLGLPLFPGASEYDLLKRMMEILGGQPPDNILRDAKNTGKFFKHVGRILSDAIPSAYKILSEEEYEARESKKLQIGKQYFKYNNLEDIISHYPYRNNLLEDEILKESSGRRALIDFLRGLVEFDPGKRWSPLQAFYHPFVTGEPFTGPYKPLPETPRIPVFHPVMVDHNPGGGHWVAAGLSPQVANRNRCALYNNSPHFPRMPPSYSSSYGSLGSHGSYNDGGLGTSYGSYGDHNNNPTNPYYSPFGPGGFNIRNQVGGTFLGSSPDVRRRLQLPHNNSYNNNNNGGLGVSPSNLGHMSLGASPSQFTPPSSHSHMQMVPGASPGKYGPTSPVRGGPHGSSSLGKIAMMGQHQRRRNNLGVPSSSSYHGHHGNYEDGASTSHHHHAGYSQSMLSNASSPYNNWRPPVVGSISSSSSQGGVPAPFSSDVNNNDVLESTSLPDPADWDPNFSEESLLQEDNSDIRSLLFSFNNSMQIGTTTLTSGPARFGHAQGQPPQTSNYISLNQRIERPYQASSIGMHGNPSGGGGSYFQQINNRQHIQSGQPRFNQNQINNMSPTSTATSTTSGIGSNSSYLRGGGGERSHLNGHNRYNSDEFHPSSALLGNPIWGQRGGHSLATTLPPRNEYGQIL